jgi:hypothetical protein
VPRDVRRGASTVEIRRRASLQCRPAVWAGSAPDFSRSRGNGRRKEARQGAMRIFLGWMRIASRSPRRTGAGRPHHLMRDLENHPTHSTIQVSGTGFRRWSFSGFRVRPLPENLPSMEIRGRTRAQPLTFGASVAILLVLFCFGAAVPRGARYPQATGHLAAACGAARFAVFGTFAGRAETPSGFAAEAVRQPGALFASAAGRNPFSHLYNPSGTRIQTNGQGQV